MSSQTAQLLEAFEALPEDEKQQFTVEFLRRRDSVRFRPTGRCGDRQRGRSVVGQPRMTPVRGQVWLFDLGMAQKVRPALVISVAFEDADRALVTIVPHTASLRGSRFEIPVLRWLGQDQTSESGDAQSRVR
jgi:hypothetical protein